MLTTFKIWEHSTVPQTGKIKTDKIQK